jgi:DNA-binding NarL/FixJ family response regulator
VSVRVLIVDDQPLARAGLRKIFEVDPAIEVVAEAEDGLGAVEATRRTDPDVVVMDIRMPNVDGLEATRRITARDPERPRVLVLTTFGLDEYVYGALRAGASGFMLKNAPPEHLLSAVAVVARGDALIDPSVTRSVIARFARLPDPGARFGERVDTLTPREREVLAAIARGLTNAEIAETFVVSAGTVKTHVSRLLTKLGLRDRVQAVIFAYEAGLVTPGEEATPPPGPATDARA